MKKSLVLMCAVALTLGVAACDNKKDNNADNPNAASNTTMEQRGMVPPSENTYGTPAPSDTTSPTTPSPESNRMMSPDTTNTPSDTQTDDGMNQQNTYPDTTQTPSEVSPTDQNTETQNPTAE